MACQGYKLYTMDKENRRKKIIETIRENNGPISASALARKYGVSRQIIVGDIELLRAEGYNIIATNSGYIPANQDKSVRIKLKNRQEDTFDKLCAVVDEGARITEITIEHSMYGKITCPLKVANRAEAKAYTQTLAEVGPSLESLTGGVHYITVEADNDIILLRVQKALNDKGYLCK